MAETPSTPGSDAQGSADPQTFGVSPEGSQIESAPEGSQVEVAPEGSEIESAPEAITDEPVPQSSAAAGTPEADPSASTPSSPAAESAPPEVAPAAEIAPGDESAPSPEPATPLAVAEAPEPAPSQPAGVATTLSVPPLDTENGGGGEWDLLVGMVQGWFGSGEPQRQWQRIRGPLKGFAILVAVILALRLYATAVSTIDSIPVISGLLELAGLIASLQFLFTRLVRSSERRQVIDQWRQRWQAFRGRG